MNIYSIKTKHNETETILLSMVDPANAQGIPLNSKCIVGRLKNSSGFPSPDNILLNPDFLTHFHKTIVFFSQFADQIIALSEKERGGFVYIIDQRNGEQDKPKPEDIIGSFEVAHGAVVSESYAPNPSYQPISETGAFVLQKELEALLVNTAY